MKKTVLFAICVSIISSNLMSGCFDSPTENNSYYYSIKIVAQKPLNYTIYAPIAHESGSNNSMEKIVSYIRISQGAGEFEVAWTEFGPALKIESNDTINLIAEYEDKDDYKPYCLSMLCQGIDDEIKEHWIFCNSTEQGVLDVSLKLRAEAGECCGEVREEQTEPGFQTISCDGWQKIKILYTVIG